MEQLLVHKNKIIVVFVVLFLIVGLLFVSSSLKQDTNTTLSSPTPKSSLPAWNNFEPNESSYEEILSKLGQPISESQDISNFKSSSATRNHQVYFKDRKAQLIKQVVTAQDNLKTTYITNTYGQAPLVLYGEDAEDGMYLYVYSFSGVAFLGNLNTEDLREIWYFQAVSNEEFKNLYAKDYSTNFAPSGF